MSSEQRLHPISLIFVLGGQLRAFVLPAIVVFITSRNLDSAYLVPLGFIAIAAIAAFLRWFTFRYRYGERELTVRSGVLFRNERNVPYERIQNLDIVQSPVHRVLGVATVHIQTGGGREPEATFSVVPLHALDEMRARLSASHRVAVPTAAPSQVGDAVTESAPELLALSPRDLLLCGFIENRGMFLILAALGVLTQLDGAAERVAQWIERRLPWLGTTIDAARDTVMNGRITVSNVAAVLAALFVVLLFIRVLSMVWAVVRLYDYRLRREGDDLRAEYGLLTRVVATIPLRRIQVISIDETLLHRLFGLAAVRVSTAGGGTGASGVNEREWLAPLIARTALPSLLERVQPGLDVLVDWQPVHPRAFRRVFIVSALRAAVVTALAALFVVRLAVPVFLILLVRAWLRSRMRVRHLGWGLSSNAVLVRGGWLRRRTSAIRYSRVQSVATTQTPFDRRAGMATIFVDAAGGGGRDVPYLPQQTAADLRATITGRAAAAVFTW